MQLQSFLESNSVLEKFQSGFRSRHSNESTLLKVHNDIALAVDTKSPVVLVLLDLTAAFDGMDHSVLLSHLSNYIGIQGTALKRFTFYLSTRTFSVMVGDLPSSSAPLSCILFSMYMLPLGYSQEHSLKPNTDNAQSSLLDCIADIKQWLAQNVFNLNDAKTECVVFGGTVTGGIGSSVQLSEIWG